MNLVIYCADVGSIRGGRFGWARAAAKGGDVQEERGGDEIVDLAESVVEDLAAGRAVALGFECPLFVPVPDDPLLLGCGRDCDGNRPWSAGAGIAVLGVGLVQAPWLLAKIRGRCPKVEVFLDWPDFVQAERGLFLWEAFVTGSAKGGSHRSDAGIAVSTFREALPDPSRRDSGSNPRVLSLIGAAMIWSDLSNDLALLHKRCLVLRAVP